MHENWNRYYDPATGNYLQIDPLLVRPTLVSLQARGGKTFASYQYAASNPLRFSDPTGLYVPKDKQRLCPNWDEALKRAREKAGCTGQPTTCACAAALMCDVCPTLEDGKGPDALFQNLGKNKLGQWRAGHTTLGLNLSTGEFYTSSAEFDLIICNFEGDAFVDALAATILHEAGTHGCSQSTAISEKVIATRGKDPDEACFPGALNK